MNEDFYAKEDGEWFPPGLKGRQSRRDAVMEAERHSQVQVNFPSQGSMLMSGRGADASSSAPLVFSAILPAVLLLLAGPPSDMSKSLMEIVLLSFIAI